jgi:membrane-associated phospholipid phosphatase
MRVVSWAGYMPQAVVVVLALSLPLYAASLRWESVIAVWAALGETLLNLLVKLFVHRPRPTADLVHVVKMLASFSFPSGHVMFYSGFFGFLWFLAYTHLKPSPLRSLLLVGFGLLVASVGLSRIYLGEHWASDVVGGYLLGGLGLFLIVRLYQWGNGRFFV